ncbi:MAG: penicillin-binding protein A [Clostridia bacterium]|nr:penicillin-binding protein A [Clostridia bacterium]
MKRKTILIRLVALLVVMLTVGAVLTTRSAYLQLVRGEEYLAASERNTMRTYVEKASRGEILDRNGKQLVSNSVGFEIVFDYYAWSKQEQNDVILALVLLMRSANLPYNDSLPVTAQAPFTYTYQDRSVGDAARLYKFIGEQKGWKPSPSATEIVDLLCEKYGVSDELTPEDRRAVAGVRYEMQRRDFSSYTPYTFATGVDIETVSLISERARLLPGVTIEVDDVRQYDTEYAAHLLGRVGLLDPEEYAVLREQGYAMNAITGKDGLEKSLEKYLRGIDGKRSVKSNIDGVVLEDFISTPPQPGSNCLLTLDLDLQAVAERALASTIENIRATKKELQGKDAEGGAVVVLDVNTGEVLAMASYPTYDPNQYSTYLQDELRPLYNRAISGAYPPGSTFKMVTAIAGLEEGVISPQTRIRDLGKYMYYASSNYTPACWIYRKNGGTHGNINVSQAIKYSCNYFFYDVSRQLGIERLNVYAKELGLGQKTGIELFGEKAGNLAGPESRAEKGGDRWMPGETIQAGIGQSEQQFTPLQLCSYVATVANGGTRYQPHLLREVKSYDNTKTVETIAPTVAGKIDMKQSTRDAVFAGMLGVTTDDGTASFLFRDFPISVAGKTGSAQTVTGKRSDHGVFVSFAPYDKPEIAVCVVGEYAGSGGNMAPVAIEIYNQYFGFNTPEETPEQPAP